MRSLLLIIAALFISHSIYAQVKILPGQVVDDGDEPVVGCSVFIKGTRTGTSTDFNGKFTISIPLSSVPCTLVFSSVGYETKEIRITKKEWEKKNLKVTLPLSSSTLSEVIVTGYGTAKRKDVTSSVSTVSADAGYSGYMSAKPLSGKNARHTDRWIEGTGCFR